MNIYANLIAKIDSDTAEHGPHFAENETQFDQRLAKFGNKFSRSCLEGYSNSCRPRPASGPGRDGVHPSGRGAVRAAAATLGV